MQKKKINDYLKREKNIKTEYGRNIYQNMSEKKNKNLKDIKQMVVKLKNFYTHFFLSDK